MFNHSTSCRRTSNRLRFLATTGLIWASLATFPTLGWADEVDTTSNNLTATKQPTTDNKQDSQRFQVDETSVKSPYPTVTTISHTPVESDHDHSHDETLSQESNQLSTSTENDSQTSTHLVQDGKEKIITSYQPKPVPSEVENTPSTPSQETTVQAQNKESIEAITKRLTMGKIPRIRSFYQPKPYTTTPENKTTPSTENTNNANKTTPVTPATKPATSTNTNPTDNSKIAKPTTPATNIKSPATTPVNNAKPMPKPTITPSQPSDRTKEIWQKNNTLTETNYSNPHWASTEATVFINAKNPAIVAAYKEAIATWNQTGAFHFYLTDDKGKANIIADERNEANVAAPLGLTYTTYYLPTKQYSNANVYLNSYHVQNNYYQKNGGKLLHTAQHELGHAIGLDHNSAQVSVMEPMGGKTSIQAIDIANVKNLYRNI